MNYEICNSCSNLRLVFPYDSTRITYPSDDLIQGCKVDKEECINNEWKLYREEDNGN